MTAKRLTVAIPFLALLLAAQVLADCPDGMVELRCDSATLCQPAGSTCCGGEVCAPDQFCLSCGGNQFCREAGSSCCGELACPPGQHCAECGTSMRCLPDGEDCPLGNMD